MGGAVPAVHTSEISIFLRFPYEILTSLLPSLAAKLLRVKQCFFRNPLECLVFLAEVIASIVYRDIVAQLSLALFSLRQAVCCQGGSTQCHGWTAVRCKQDLQDSVGAV